MTWSVSLIASGANDALEFMAVLNWFIAPVEALTAAGSLGSIDFKFSS